MLPMRYALLDGILNQIPKSLNFFTQTLIITKEETLVSLKWLMQHQVTWWKILKQE